MERSGTGRRQWRRRGFRSRRSVAEAAVRADRVVVPPPGLDQHLGFGQAVEDFAVEQLVAQRAIEAFVVAVLPGRRGRDVKRLHANLGEPFLHRRRDKLAAVIGPDVCWRPARDEQFRQRRQNVLVTEPTRDHESQAFPAGLVEDRQDPELPAVMGAAFDEVIGPDMPRILRPQPDARTIVQP